MTNLPAAAASFSFEPIQSDRTFEVVVNRIRDKLEAGELRPGDKLPPERELAKQLNVSRNVVREALRTLENAGVVKTRKGSKGGAFVEEGRPGLISQALRDLIVLKAIKLKDLFEARALMLEMVIDVVERRGVVSDLSALASNVEATEVAARAGDSARRIELARAFYHELANLTGNKALVFNIDAQTELIQTYLRYRVSDMDADQLLQSRRVFLDHLRQQQFAAAKVELSEHLGRVHSNLWTR